MQSRPERRAPGEREREGGVCQESGRRRPHPRTTARRAAHCGEAPRDSPEPAAEPLGGPKHEMYKSATWSTRMWSRAAKVSLSLRRSATSTTPSRRSMARRSTGTRSASRGKAMPTLAAAVAATAVGEAGRLRCATTADRHRRRCPCVHEEPPRRDYRADDPAAPRRATTRLRRPTASARAAAAASRLGVYAAGARWPWRVLRERWGWASRRWRRLLLAGRRRRTTIIVTGTTAATARPTTAPTPRRVDRRYDRPPPMAPHEGYGYREYPYRERD